MRKNSLLYISLVFALFLSVAPTILGQERIIEPSEGFVGDVIAADTLADGSRSFDSYIFRRDAQYWVSDQISNTGFPITLKAEAGSGALPKLNSYPNADGNLGRILDGRDDAYIYDLYLDGMGPDINDANLTLDPTYRMSGQLLRAGAAGKVLVIDGCVLNNTGQVIVRTNSGARKVQITNSIIANSGQLSRDNLGNGRIIDFRNGITDTLILRNNTMVNSYDRLIRHYGAAANSETAYVDYLELDHNTIVHNTGAYGFIYLGDISGSVKITNNLFYNPMTLGVDPADQQRYAEVMNISELGSDGNPENPLIIEQPNTLYNPTYTMSHNVIVYDQTIKDYFTTNSVTAAEPLATRLAAKVVGDNPFTTADVTLANIPDVMVDVMNWYRALALTEVGAGMITTSDFALDRKDASYWMETLDASYSTDDPAFVGTDGEPVGDMNWNSTVTGVESNLDVVPAQYSLENNYPNPFNPSTTIKFGIPEQSKVTLQVFSILGQSVFELTEQSLSAGSHSYDFDASALSSGIYIYSISAVGISGENFASSKKMTLLK